MNMTMLNYESALLGVADFLRDKVADYLDINRHHVLITKLAVEPMWESQDEDSYSCAREVAYKEDANEEEWLVWFHVEGPEIFKDLIMKIEDFQAGLIDDDEEN